MLALSKIELGKVYLNSDTKDSVVVHNITYVSSGTKIMFDATINKHRQTLTMSKKAVQAILRRLTT